MLDFLITALLVGTAIHETYSDDKDSKARKAAREAAIEKQQREAREARAASMADKEAAIRAAKIEEAMLEQALYKKDTLFVKLAMCCYIAWADGKVVASEKKMLDDVYLDIYHSFPKDQDVQRELNSIYSTPEFSFVNLEKYLSRVPPETIASLLEVADAATVSDGNASEQEQMCIYRIRKYLSDRTGKDYTGIDIDDSEIDLSCPGCYAQMELQLYSKRAVCPYCGNIKPLGKSSSAKKKTSAKTNSSAKKSTRKTPAPKNSNAVKKTAADITFRCPVCSTLLSAPEGTPQCICAKCKTRLSLSS